MISAEANGGTGLLGVCGARPRNSKKESILSFKEGHVSMELKLVTPYDEASCRFLRPIPKIVFLVDGKYVRMPVDPVLLKDLGSFMGKLSEVIHGSDVPDDGSVVDQAVRRIRSAMNMAE